MNPPSGTEYQPGSQWWVRRVLSVVWGRVNARERDLWLLVVAALFADFGLTLYGLRLGLVEQNPLARGLISAFGLPAILALKGGALAVAAGLRPLMPDQYGAMVPLALAISWCYAVAVNTFFIVSILT